MKRTFKCSGCNLPGHCVTNCMDENIIIFREKFEEVVNISVGYSLPMYLFGFLSKLFKKKMIILGGKTKFSRSENVEYLFGIYYGMLDSLTPSELAAHRRISLYSIPRETRIRVEHELANQIAESAAGEKPRKFKKIIFTLAAKEEAEKEECECSICFEPFTKEDGTVKTQCNHLYCSPCMDGVFTHVDKKKTPCCAMCRSEITNLCISDSTVLDTFMQTYH